MLHRLPLIGFMVLMLVGFGCAPKKIAPISPEDNPQHHYLQGMLSLEKGDIETGMGKFKRALKLNKKFSPGLAGMSLALAMRAQGQAEVKYREADVSEALNYLKKARKKAKEKNEKFIYYTTAIRVYTHARSNDWLKKAEDAFRDAWAIEEASTQNLPYYQEKEAAAYFMGQAYLAAYLFREAEDKFAVVLSEKPEGKWQPLANKAYQKVQKIMRATAHYTIGNVAQKIAVKEIVNRADVAALLVDEIKLDKLFAGRIPIESEIAAMRPEFIPADLANSPFKSEIMTVLKWNLRGLEPQYDETSRAFLFGPQNPVRRKELALALEDILIKLIGSERLATEYIGTEHSPFPDVDSTAPWFNAAITVTSRGLMEPELSGEFRPDDYADGAELLLAVFKLRHVLNIH